MAKCIVQCLFKAPGVVDHTVMLRYTNKHTVFILLRRPLVEASYVVSHFVPFYCLFNVLHVI